MPFIFPCAYCGTSYTDKRDEIFNGMLLKCARCGKPTRVDLVKDQDDVNRVTMGRFYKPDE